MRRIIRNPFIIFACVLTSSFFLSKIVTDLLTSLGINTETSYFSIAVSIFLPLGMMIYIPTRVSEDVRIIHERIQRKLQNDKAVYNEALELLKWVGSEPNTSFEYTSATPYFGLFKSSEDPEDEGNTKENEWKLALESRLRQAKIDNSITTNIYALKWEPFTSGRAALFELCKTLANSSKDKDKKAIRALALQLYETGLKQWRDFISMLQHNANNTNTHIYISKYQHEVFSFVAQKGSEKRCIFAFISSANSEFKMFGTFAMYDIHWINIAENYINERRSISKEITNTILTDNRSSDQKKRDHDLLIHYTSLSDNYRNNSDSCTENIYNYYFCDGSDEFKYYINKQVFPFNLSKEKDLWPIALNKDYFKKLNSTSSKKTIGIDINTGCGILAIHLSTFCDKVFATESDSKAMGNALLNYNEFKKNKHNSSPISFYCSENINSIQNSINTQTKSTYIITLKHLFYKSYFCHMDYKYDYEQREKCAKNYICTQIPQSSYKNIKEKFDTKCTHGCQHSKQSAHKDSCLKAGKSQIIYWLQSIDDVLGKTESDIYIIIGVHENLCTTMAFSALFSDQYGYLHHDTIHNKDDSNSFLYIFKKSINNTTPPKH